MGLLSLLGRVNGKRGSADLCRLEDHDIVVLIDDSTRMLKKGRWGEVSGVMEELVTKVRKCNKRGINVHFLNQQKREGINLKTRSETRKLFKETTLYYGQPLAARLNDLFDQYVQGPRIVGSEKRKRDILVVSDGAPSDDIESALVSISKRLDELELPKPQLRIRFVQVGNDRSAAGFLRRLEEDLPVKHNIKDLVSIELCDGTPLTIAKLECVLLKGAARNQDVGVENLGFSR